MADDLPEFDTPFFKRLANNDTGNAPGHQAGIVIPKDLDSFFPTLPPATPANPTVEQRVKALLVVPNIGSQLADARYQHQTWGGTRQPERRLTDNLSFLRNQAHADDFLLFERSLDDLNLFRLTLLKSGSKAHQDLLKKVGSKRWGAVSLAETPVEDAEIVAAETAQIEHESKPLELFDNTAATVESRVQRIARSVAFQKRVVEIYQRRCAVCGEGLLHPIKGAEVEAAHIVPRRLKGADDARNGLALCRAHHWAFDRGLFGIQPKRLILVPTPVKEIKQNKRLADLDGKNLTIPTPATLSPSNKAFEWHLANIVKL